MMTMNDTKNRGAQYHMDWSNKDLYHTVGGTCTARWSWTGSWTGAPTVKMPDKTIDAGQELKASDWQCPPGFHNTFIKYLCAGDRWGGWTPKPGPGCRVSDGYCKGPLPCGYGTSPRQLSDGIPHAGLGSVLECNCRGPPQVAECCYHDDQQ